VKLSRLACILVMYSLASPAFAQNMPNELLDRIHSRIRAAADAAALILQADFYRREADRLRGSGQAGEANAQLRLAKDTIADAVSHDESLRSDPLLQDYLRQLKSDLVTFGSPKAALVPVNDKPLNQVSAAYPFIAEVLAQHELPQQLAAVVVVESAGNPSALSPKGARGLWQLMPGTARRYGLRVDHQTDERLDPLKSTYAAARYLRELYGIFRDWPLALAAYNAGENRIQGVIERTGIQRFADMATRELLPAETIHYVPAVLNLMGLH
jgi:soluble lytic murein transglycosylase-like protein